MKKYFTLSLLIFSLTLSSMSTAQWSAGVSVNLKNEKPKRGIGFIVSRNLPFQFAVVGFKVQLEADYYVQDSGNRTLREKNVFLSLAGTFFLSNIQPYVSLGTGYAFLSDNHSLLFRGTAGIQLSLIKPVYPFIEFKSCYYVSQMYEVNRPMEDLQVTGALGIRFEF
jgi:hypothetical protein